MKTIFYFVLTLGVLVMVDSVVNSQRYHGSPITESGSGSVLRISEVNLAPFLDRGRPVPNRAAFFLSPAPRR